MFARKLPEPIKRVLLKVYYCPIDPIGTLKGEGKSMIPPKRLQSSGGGDYETIGREYTKQLVQMGGLKPTDSVLDIGCGIGRMAIHLTDYLKGGSYIGFDVMPHSISWCNKRIRKKYNNFQFNLANIYNGMYNKKGKYSASNYRFPYDDNTFDFVFLISVFTHMKRHEHENYLSEATRVLKEHGTCFSTYYLLNEETVKKMKYEDNATQQNFQYRLDEVSYSSYKDVAEIAIAYEEDYIRHQYEKNNLRISKIQYGPWRDGGHPVIVLDTVVANKRGL